MPLIDESKIDLPPTLMPLEATQNGAIAYQRVTKNCDKQFSENLVHQIRHTYFAMIAALDDMVGRVLQTVDDLGMRDNTYVIFSSDHGEMAGDQNQVLKRSMYEASSHVPLIVRGPDVQKGKTIDTPVSLVDLYPTFMDMAEINYANFANRSGYPEALDGESLLPQLAGTGERQRDWAMCEYHGDRCASGTFMLRQGDWKYVKHVGFESELFNISEDPDETTDLINKKTNIAQQLDQVLTGNFDCEGIDARAKQYDKESFIAWSKEAKADGTYHDTMARVYSGYDRLCIEDIAPWTDENEQQLEAWLAK
jgi:arylsulfatase K